MAHESVLFYELLDGLGISPGDTVVDATVGGGGHALGACERLNGKGTLVCIDRDAGALEEARRRLTACPVRVLYVEGWYRDIAGILERLGLTEAMRVMFDLGMSTLQLEESRRGFSFHRDEPLLMTFIRDPKEGDLTAATIVNVWPARDIARLIREYGEERNAERITNAIVKARSERPIVSSSELAEVISRAVGRRGKIHPATKTFQALRIAVNDELEGLKEGLTAALGILAPSGRIGVISFHSLEDRVVKRLFRSWEREAKGRTITKKPVIPSRAEVLENPRARSAKLRIFEARGKNHDA